jgi:CBS domain-containing protein
MKVRELMTPDPRTCTSNDTLDVAARAMWEADCGVVPVVDAVRCVVGMITDRDICMAAYIQGKPLTSIKVASAMAPNVVSCKPDDELTVAERTMQTAQVRRLPVVDAQGRLAGLLALGDLARHAGKDRAGKVRVSAEEVAATLGVISQERPARAAAAAGSARAKRLLAAQGEGEC